MNRALIKLSSIWIATAFVILSFLAEKEEIAHRLSTRYGDDESL